MALQKPRRRSRHPRSSRLRNPGQLRRVERYPQTTPREGVKHFRNAINNIGGRILGAIINKAGRKKGLGSYGSYKYYAYDYEYGKDRNS